MQGYIPNSDEFMYQDPEQIDEYCEWQQFAKFLVKDNSIKDFSVQQPENRRRLRRYITVKSKQTS